MFYVVTGEEPNCAINDPEKILENIEWENFWNQLNDNLMPLK